MLLGTDRRTFHNPRPAHDAGTCRDLKGCQQEDGAILLSVELIIASGPLIAGPTCMHARMHAWEWASAQYTLRLPTEAGLSVL